MILSQNSPIRFFSDKQARQWNKTPGSIESMVFYESGYLPMFAVIVDHIYIENSLYEWRLKLYDYNDNEVESIAEISLEGGGWQGRFTVLYPGTYTEGFGEGYYYYRLYNDVEEYFSDMFASTSKEAELLKIEVQNTSVRIGGYPTLYASGTFTNTFYLNAGYLGVKPKIDQTGIDQDGITTLLYGGRAIQREFEIDANDSIFIYLSSLGLLKVNGTVTITFGYETWNITDIVVEETANHYNGLYQLKLSFVDESESMAVING
jgi:hypothetical protein